MAPCSSRAWPCPVDSDSSRGSSLAPRGSPFRTPADLTIRNIFQMCSLNWPVLNSFPLLLAVPSCSEYVFQLRCV